MMRPSKGVEPLTFRWPSIQRFRNRLEKRYRRSDLLIDEELLEHRLGTITRVSESYPGIPRTHFNWEGSILVVSQQRIHPQPLPLHDSVQLMQILHQLASLLESISPQLVHGDVNRKNLMFDGERLQIIDWEPALRQLRQGRETLLYTEPYLSAQDRQLGRLSTETDKLAFFFLCFEWLHRFNPIGNLREVVHQRMLGEGELAPIPESELLAGSFAHVLTEAKRFPRWRLQPASAMKGVCLEEKLS